MSKISVTITSWNDVLLSVSRPPIKNGWCPNTSAPPTGFPHFDEFFCVGRMDKVDTRLLRLLPEFEHWRNPDFGSQVQIKDLELLASGRMSIVGPFQRGPKHPDWYDRVREADRVKKQSHRETIAKMVGPEHHQIEDIQVPEVGEKLKEVEKRIDSESSIESLDCGTRKAIDWATNEYLRSLPDPASRLDHSGLEEHISNLAREVQQAQPERNIENIETELYNKAFEIRDDLNAPAREIQRRIDWELEEQARRQTQLAVSADVEVHSQPQQAGATPSSKQDCRRPGAFKQLNKPFSELLAPRSEIPPKIGKEVPRGSTEGKCEAGPGPSTLTSRLRSSHHVTADNTDVTTSAIDDDATQWQKAVDRLKALEARQKVAQSLTQPIPKAVLDHARGLSSPSISGHSYGTYTRPRTAPRSPLMSKSSEEISLNCHEDTGGPKNRSDCLARLRDDIVNIENLARKMRAEYQVARAKIEGTEDSVVVNGDNCAEEGGRKGKERV